MTDNTPKTPPPSPKKAIPHPLPPGTPSRAFEYAINKRELRLNGLLDSRAKIIETLKKIDEELKPHKSDEDEKKKRVYLKESEAADIASSFDVDRNYPSVEELQHQLSDINEKIAKEEEDLKQHQNIQTEYMKQKSRSKGAKEPEADEPSASDETNNQKSGGPQ